MKTHIIQNEPDQTDGTSAGDEVVDKRNVALRMAHWSARHWKLAIFGWLAFAVLSFGIGSAIGIQNLDTDTTGPGESGRVDKLLDAGFQQPAGESVLIQSAGVTTADPGFRAAVLDTERALRMNPDVQKIRSPLASENSGQISEDGRSALVEFQIAGASEDAADKIEPVVDKVGEVQDAHPELFVGQFGDASAEKELNQSFSDDLKKAGLLSVPITLIILLVAFGAVVAAAIPLLLALTAVLATMGLIAIPSQVLPMDDSISAIVLLIGLAVGVDYSMFYLKREREERASGRSEHAALEAAAATSGRSVLISGLTVIVAMAGMFLTGDQGFASFGVATITVVAVAMVGSLTILPAILYRLGDRVDRGRVPFVGRLMRADGEGRMWSAIIDRVLRHPRVSVVLAGGLLVAIDHPGARVAYDRGVTGDVPAIAGGDRHLQPRADSVPGRRDPRRRRRQDSERERTRGALGDRRAREAGARDRHDAPADNRRRQRRRRRSRTSRSRSTATGRTTRRTPPWRRCGTTSCQATVGAIPDAETGVTGLTAGSQGLERQDEIRLPLVVGFVLPVRLRPDARLVPLDRDRGTDDRPRTCCRSARRTARWSSCSSTAGARECSTSSRRPASTRSCRSCCS